MGELDKHQKRRQRLENRNKAVKKEYELLSSKKANGVRVYAEEYKMSVLADKFFLSEKTIEDIVFNRINYEDEQETQLKLNLNEE